MHTGRPLVLQQDTLPTMPYSDEKLRQQVRNGYGRLHDEKDLWNILEGL